MFVNLRNKHIEQVLECFTSSVLHFDIEISNLNGVKIVLLTETCA